MEVVAMNADAQGLSIQEIEAKNAAVLPVLSAVRDQVRQVVVGQQEMVDRLLVGLLTGGHVLLEGVPGLAKTLTVRTLASALNMDFRRIQFTPDLLPADIVGTEIYNPRDGGFTTRRGPVFANILLADEINRAPAKVQSALLEAMQERQVTLGGVTHRLPDPFLVLATQNPIEQEGTYPLPEAQSDRFLMKVRVGYPSREEEREILTRSAQPLPTIEPVSFVENLPALKAALGRLKVEPVVLDYIVEVICATRAPDKVSGLSHLSRLIEFGASPRATVALAACARAHALMEGRGFVTPDDVKAMAPDVLRHRVLLSYEAEAEGLTPEVIIDQILQKVRIL